MSAVCPLCGDPMRPWMTVPTDWRRPEPGRGYQLWWCDRSDFGMVWPRPTPAELREAYEVDYFTHGGESGPDRANGGGFLDRVRGHLAWRADRSRPMTVESVTPLLRVSRARVLDVGCGSGGVLESFRGAGHEVSGVEIDPRARAVATSKGLEVHEGTAEALPAAIAGKKYDLVIMSHVLEHTTDPLLAARNAASLLEEGGVLVVEVPNSASLGGARAGPAWLWLDVPRHLDFFTQQSLGQVLRRAGLTLERTDWTGYCRQLNPPWLTDEAHIRQVFEAVGGPRIPASNPWALLARSAFAPPAKKYDSVRIAARRT